MEYTDVLELILDTNDVTVGGGSASALSGAVACGLIGMVCKLSIKKDYGYPPEKQLEFAAELEKLRDELLKGVVKDANAFGVIRDAMKMPKTTDEEKSIRRKAMSEAGVIGATAPMENARLCKKVYEIVKKLEGKTNPNCESDIVIGKNLAKVATNGCVMNIEANLPLVKDEEKLAEFKKNIQELKID